MYPIHLRSVGVGGGSLTFYGYHKCYQRFDTLSRGRRLGVNFRRNKNIFAKQTPTEKKDITK